NIFCLPVIPGIGTRDWGTVVKGGEGGVERLELTVVKVESGGDCGCEKLDLSYFITPLSLKKMAPKKTPMTDHAIKQLIAQGMVDALVDYEANKGSGNGDDSHNTHTLAPPILRPKHRPKFGDLVNKSGDAMKFYMTIQENPSHIYGRFSSIDPNDDKNNESNSVV
ncbi:hypothetical protein Tco_0588261, partial [Tanacetum coccineum]